MTATTNQVASDPGEIEALLPWHVAGTLNMRDARRVEDALSRDPALVRQYEAIREEYAETIRLNESLGAPSARAMQKLFEQIDSEPARAPAPLSLTSRLLGFFDSLQPRTLAYASAAAAVLLLLQAGIIGTLVKQPGFQTASYESSAKISGTPLLVRFAAEARADDITKFLDANAGAIVGGPKAGLFRIQFGDKALSKDDAAQLLKRVQAEKIIGFAAAE